jgi:hypothetical protein
MGLVSLSADCSGALFERSSFGVDPDQRPLVALAAYEQDDTID